MCDIFGTSLKGGELVYLVPLVLVSLEGLKDTYLSALLCHLLEQEKGIMDQTSCFAVDRKKSSIVNRTQLI